jgi:hypothetical protein
MTISIPQINFGGGELSPNTYARVDIGKFGQGAKTLRNFFVRAEGGVSNRPGFEYVKEVKDSTETVRLIPFEFNDEQSYVLVFGDQYMRVVTNAGTVLEASQNITGATQANPVELTVTGHSYSTGDEVFISSVGGMTELNSRFFTITSTGANTFTLDGEDGTTHTAYTSGGTVARVFELTTPYLQTELETLKFRQSNDVLFMVHPNHEPRKLNRLGAANWTLTVTTFAPNQAAPTGVTVTPQGASGSTTYEYQVTAVAEETLEESLVASGSTSTGNATLSSTNFNRITWTGASGAERYNVYKRDNGLYGFIGSTETLQFDDDNIEADTLDTAPKARNPFSGAGNYPGAVGLHEQRSVYGGSIDSPLTVYMSQTSQFDNFNVSSPTRESDAVTFRLITGQGNTIRHIRSFEDRLFVFTSGVVWNVQPGGDVDAITPTSKKIRVEEYLASTDVPPITIKKNILMVSGKQNRGFEVHTLGYSLQTDSYAGSDLTVISRHLFEGFTIREWAYAERPYRLVAAVRDDGDIVVMTYLQEQQIFAWARWETQGEFESICVVPEGQEDVIYVVVKRTINGVDKKYIERLHTRSFSTIEDAFFIDSGLTYDGSPTTTLSGLDHLEGETLVALADGNLVTNLTVTSGAVTLPNEASKIQIGLSYDATMETLPLNIVQQEATIDRKKVVKDIVVRVLDTRGIFAGSSATALEEYPSRSTELWGDPAATLSDVIRVPVSGDWERDIGVTIKTEAALPMTLLSVIPGVNIGR